MSLEKRGPKEEKKSRVLLAYTQSVSSKYRLQTSNDIRAETSVQLGKIIEVLVCVLLSVLPLAHFDFSSRYAQ
jgi:hypothetical protein